MHTGKYLEKNTHVVLSANVKFLTIFYITNVMNPLEHVNPESEEKNVKYIRKQAILRAIILLIYIITVMQKFSQFSLL